MDLEKGTTTVTKPVDVKTGGALVGKGIEASTLNFDLCKPCIKCRCGKVTCTFTELAPRHSLYCCCVDCYDKNAWAAEKGGVFDKLPANLKKQGEGAPLLLTYFGARIKVNQGGKDKLSFNKVSKHRHIDRGYFPLTAAASHQCAGLWQLVTVAAVDGG